MNAFDKLAGLLPPGMRFRLAMVDVELQRGENAQEKFNAIMDEITAIGNPDIDKAVLDWVNT